MVLRHTNPEKYDSLLQKILDFISEILAVEWDYRSLVHTYSGDRTNIKGKGPDGENVSFLTLKDHYLQEHMGWVVWIGRTKLEPRYFMSIRNQAISEQRDAEEEVRINPATGDNLEDWLWNRQSE